MDDSKVVSIDAAELNEWLDALDDVVEHYGVASAEQVIEQLAKKLNMSTSASLSALNTAYENTISVAHEPDTSHLNFELEEKIQALVRWNAVAMVVKAGKKAPELGGHIASYASAATLYEVGFNHFFHAKTPGHGGDLLYIQGHVAPGIYARAFLEGRLSAKQLGLFRQEIEKDGLSSYPHPWLMPDFWQFPTVSMGLGPLSAIYQAKFMRYLSNRKLANTAQRNIWCFCGDGEMDEPESLGAISLAGREQLDNLTFVINCNLQRLDGPVRGNGKVIQEFESVFRGAGWNVIKVVWGGQWDRLLKQDSTGKLRQLMQETLDGDYQNFKAHGPAYAREHFFGKYPETKAMVADLSDDDIAMLQRGGHDSQKVYAAYAKAIAHKGQPTVILVKTVKGYGMGSAGEAQNNTHQQKKMTPQELRVFRDRFDIPITDSDLADCPFYRPDSESAEIKHMLAQRKQLGGFLPKRELTQKQLPIPSLSDFQALLESSQDRVFSTTMAFVRLLNIMLKNKALAPHLVPIVPDEARTFGMEGLFRQIGIFAPHGQKYQPVDAKQIMFYKEDKQGQILEEGISEAGAFSSWLAAATAYATHDVPMLPLYIYYSMFGFQRIGDLAWLAGDAQAQGFLLGATAGRTTLAGEGLQHQDGHGHILASTIPNCVAYDPAYAYELAVIMQHGIQEMYGKGRRVFYYISVMNENYQHPKLPENAEIGIIKGMYRLHQYQDKSAKKIRLLGSGTILQEVLKARKILAEEFQVSSEVWSVTSFNELRREGMDIVRDNRLHPERTPAIPYVSQCLDGNTPVIAATDYMQVYADQIREYMQAPYCVLGTDGFGRSDTRAQLRHFFEVDSKNIVFASLSTLAEQGDFPKANLGDVMQKLGVNPNKPNPTTC